MWTGSASGRGSIDCGGVLTPGPNGDPSSRQVPASRNERRKKTFILFVLVCALAVISVMRFPPSLQGTDFPDFYCAARMLAAGQGHQLYDAGLQRQYQARFAGRVGTLYIHPPFEAVLYLAVAWLPLLYAYRLWCLLNLAFLAVGTRLLAKELALPWDWPAWFAASLAFVPVLLCLLQGQDSLLLLLLVVLAFTSLRRQRAVAAGCWLGLALFKFQVVLPLVLVLVLTQDKSARSALVKGFSLVAAALAGLSAAISGWSVFLAYPKFLLHLTTQPFAGVVPQAMANFRGLIYLLLHSDRSPAAITALSILSAAALIQTLVSWNKQDDFDLAFASAVLLALLVSYHLNPHDLSLLLLPLGALLQRALSRAPCVSRSGAWIILGWLGILFLPPLHVWTLKTGIYALVSLPMLALFLTVAIVAHQDKLCAIS